VTLTLRTHEFVAVTGPSGSGKTTFLNLVGLLEELTAGKYRLRGGGGSRPPDDPPPPLPHQELRLLFQRFYLIPRLTIYDNVDVPLRYRRMPAAERHRRITAALERVGLASRMRHIPAQLSGGQQQRAAVARALAGDPRVILADEPTGNLDTVMSSQIMDLL